MKTLDELFNRYGVKSDEMNERINLYFIRADKLDTMERIKHYDHSAEEAINRLIETAEALKEYRKTLYDRAQEIYAASYSLQLKIQRHIDGWKGDKKRYTVTLSKIYDTAANVKGENLIEETFDGKERFKALKRFEALRKEYPNTEAIKDIDKKSWER